MNVEGYAKGGARFRGERAYYAERIQNAHTNK